MQLCESQTRMILQTSSPGCRTSRSLIVFPVGLDDFRVHQILGSELKPRAPAKPLRDAKVESGLVKVRAVGAGDDQARAEDIVLQRSTRARTRIVVSQFQIEDVSPSTSSSPCFTARSLPPVE